MKALKWLDEHLEEYILVILLVLISCIMMLQVIMRYVFNSSLSWPEEFTRYCFVWSAFIGISYSVRRGLMLKIDAALNVINEKPRKVVEIITEIVVLAFFGYLLINSFEVVQKIYASGQRSPAMGIPMYLIYSCTIIGFSLTVLRTVQVIVLKIKELIQVQYS